MSENRPKEIADDSLSESPAMETASNAKLLYKSLHCTAIGLILCSVTVKAFELRYLLSAVGTVLMLIGLRPLRLENSWFKAGWILALLRLPLYYAVAIALSTVFYTGFFAKGFAFALAIVHPASQTLEILCIWMALTDLQPKIGGRDLTQWIIALSICYASLLFTDLLKQEDRVIAFCGDTLIFLITLVGLVAVYAKFFELAQEIAQSGYTPKAAPVRIASPTLAAGLAIILVCGIACGYRFGGRYPMRWQKEEAAASEEASEARYALLSLGFPHWVLDDLTSEDILACKGAQKVVCTYDDYIVDRDNFTGHGFHITAVGVKLDGERGHCMVFYHFIWATNPGFGGTECLQIDSEFLNGSQEWRLERKPTGRVLFDREVGVYTAPFFGIEALQYEGYGAQSLYATFSFPNDGRRLRGYICYGLEEIPSTDCYFGTVDELVCYTHQESSLFEYPVRSAQEVAVTDAFIKSPQFEKVMSHSRIELENWDEFE